MQDLVFLLKKEDRVKLKTIIRPDGKSLKVWKMKKVGMESNKKQFYW